MGLGHGIRLVGGFGGSIVCDGQRTRLKVRVVEYNNYKM